MSNVVNIQEFKNRPKREGNVLHLPMFVIPLDMPIREIAGHFDTHVLKHINGQREAIEAGLLEVYFEALTPQGKKLPIAGGKRFL